MSAAVRRISIERGHDPRDFVLIVSGGAGPLHASAIARELSIPTVLVPPLPGHFSAWGMLLADIRFDNAQTFIAQSTIRLGCGQAGSICKFRRSDPRAPYPGWQVQRT